LVPHRCSGFGDLCFGKVDGGLCKFLQQRIHGLRLISAVVPVDGNAAFPWRSRSKHDIASQDEPQFVRDRQVVWLCCGKDDGLAVRRNRNDHVFSSNRFRDEVDHTLRNLSFQQVSRRLSGV